MANPVHLTKLKEGVEAWNKWRKDKPKIRRDLTEADLTEANLRKADLRGANLLRASLADAVLLGARYDASTTWPVGFDPKAHGAILVE